MFVQLPQQPPPPQHMMHFLRERLPLFEYRAHANGLVVAAGQFTGVVVQPAAGGVEIKGAAPPGIGARILIGLGFVFGMFPGIALWILFMLTARSEWDLMRRQIGFALRGGFIPPGPGLSMDSPFLARGADAIRLAGGPQSSIKTYAPRGFLYAIPFLLLISIVCLPMSVAVYGDLDDTMDTIEADEVILKVAEENLEWRKDQKRPPKGDCPEDAIPEPKRSKYYEHSCHGCTVVDETPDWVKDDPKGYETFERGDEVLLCPDLAWFRKKRSNAVSALGSQRSILQGNREMTMIFFGGGVVALLLAGLCGVIWKKLSVTRRRKREEEIAAQQKILDDEAVALGRPA